MPLLFCGARRRALAVTLMVVATSLALTAGDALAAKGGKPTGGTGSGALTLTREYVMNSPNQWAPTWCLNEDDWHKRTWSGSLNGSLAVTEQICDSSADFSGGIWWNGGGTGLVVDLYAAGTLSDLAITSPDGITHRGVLIASNVARGGVNHYAACYVPPYMRASNTGNGFLPGATWQISLTGNISNVTYAVEARMTDVTVQEQYCPVSQQNLS